MTTHTALTALFFPSLAPFFWQCNDDQRSHLCFNRRTYNFAGLGGGGGRRAEVTMYEYKHLNLGILLYGYPVDENASTVRV